MAMIRRVWENALGEEVWSILSIGSAKEAKEIVEAFFVPDKIDPLRFWYNCEALPLCGMTSAAIELLGIEKSREPTPSLSQFTEVLDRPSFVPLWFIAAYPDVLLWHKNKLREYKNVHGWDEDGLAALNAKLFGLDLTEQNLEKKLDNFIDSEGNPRPNTLRNLLQSYKEETGRELETAVKSPEDDMYLGSEFLEALGVESNFVLIAVNTTKYYLELTRVYSNRFKNEVSLLATAGLLDAQNYIIEQTVKPLEIREMAEKAPVLAEEALLDFIISLEIKLFTVENPTIAISDIETACFGQKESIANAIQKTKNEYVSEPIFASVVFNFMNSYQFKELRRTLGVNEG